MSKDKKTDDALYEEQSLVEFFNDSGVGTFEYSEPDGVNNLNAQKITSKITGMIGVVALMSITLIIAIFVGLSYIASSSEPVVSWYKSLPEDLPEASIAERNVMFDSDGKRIAEFWVEDRRILDDLDDISDYAIDGLIATEDQRFWDHHGFDPIGTARAAISGSGGGSGITQQLVKNLQFYNQTSSEEERWDAIDISLERKIQELRYSIAYENNNSKEDILLEYFNVVSFGGPDVYSIESASQVFFDKSAADLELHEAAVLVGSVQNTSQYNLSNPDMEDNYKARQAAVLDRMAAEGMITNEEASDALEEELNIQENSSSNSGGCSRSDYPFFCEYVVDYLREDPALGEDAETRNGVIAAGGLQIETTLDTEVVDIINDYVEETTGNDNRVAIPISVVEPGTGNVVGFGFNREYGNGDDATEINLADSPTGTGSTFKTFTLAAAANAGWRESDLEFSAPCPWTNPNFDTPPQGIQNSSSCDLQGGYMDYREATAYSSNTWFVELQSRIGIPAVAEFAESVGLDGDVHERAASYTLGPQGNSPIDVTAAYATFAAEGVYCPPTPVVSVEYADGSQPRIPDNYDPADKSCHRVMSPAAASIVLKGMRANMGEDGIEDAFGEDAAIDGYDAVGKSGTNQLYNQAFGMVSPHYAMYGNAYDFAKPTNEIDGYWHHGDTRPWNENNAQMSVSAIMEEILERDGNTDSLNYNSNDWSIEEVPVDNRDFVTVPSAIGMEPEAGLSIFEGTGLNVFVDRGSCDPEEETSNQYPTGVIVGQSVTPGEQLPRGTDTEIVLCTNS